MILHPSLASANPLHYGRELTALDNLDFGSLHLDIEDSSFINNIARPQRWFNALAEIRPAWIFVHAETLDYPSETLTEIRHTGARAGLVFNPATPIDAWRYLASELDGVMVMTSEPDGQGQRFIPSMCEKIQKVRTAFPQTECWADGGITLAAAQQLAAAGAQHMVIGRALFSSSDYRATLAQFATL